MSGYPVIEHEGHYASVTTQREATGRWMAWVHFERNQDFARLKGHATTPHRVPNDYPNEEKAVLAAYDFARELINRGEVEPF
jgi:hypothetical protein